MKKIKTIKIIKPLEEEISVIISASSNTQLIDRRIMTNGIYWGTITEVAKNLGVSITNTNNGLLASAPKARLQSFVEKLHFSGVPFKGR